MHSQFKVFDDKVWKLDAASFQSNITNYQKDKVFSVTSLKFVSLIESKSETLKQTNFRSVRESDIKNEWAFEYFREYWLPQSGCYPRETLQYQVDCRSFQQTSVRI